MIEVARQAYPDRGTLMRDLAELVADQLRGACASKGHATLAVPGGTTPGPFLEALSEAELAWKDVRVMPTDERMVSERSPRSKCASRAWVTNRAYPLPQTASSVRR